MKSPRQRSSIRGTLPSLPFILFLLVLSSVVGNSFISGMFFTGTARADLAARSQEIIMAINGGYGEVPVNEGYYLYINSCNSFIEEYKDGKQFQVEDLTFDDKDILRFITRCQSASRNGIVCLAKKMKDGGFVRMCGYTLKEPELDEPIAMVLKSSTMIQVSSGSEESKSKVEVKTGGSE